MIPIYPRIKKGDLVNIPEEMKCHCGGEISPAEEELARRFMMDPADVHRFMDEWSRSAAYVAQARRKLNGSASS